MEKNEPAPTAEQNRLLDAIEWGIQHDTERKGCKPTLFEDMVQAEKMKRAAKKKRSTAYQLANFRDLFSLTATDGFLLRLEFLQRLGCPMAELIKMCMARSASCDKDETLRNEVKNLADMTHYVVSELMCEDDRMKLIQLNESSEERYGDHLQRATAIALARNAVTTANETLASARRCTVNRGRTLK